jgi:SAM-dependent methyltransferase
VRLRRRREEPGEIPRELIELSDEDRRYLTTLADETVPLPPGAEEALRDDHPRLAELREAYAHVDMPASRWTSDRVDAFLDLRHFRGETLITWHYRELPRITALKYFVLARHVRDRDAHGLLDRLGEDGAFGCWTFEYPGHGRYSRDLLESVLELGFIERAGLPRRVLDVGAGYGRLAHRMCSAFDVEDYCCVDAVPESTFLSEYYLAHRGVAPPARVVGLHEIGGLTPGSFDLAVNVHSFPECPLAAIEWWVQELVRLEVPRLLIVPNERELLSLEPDGSRRDFAPLLERAGYVPARREPLVDDPAVAELVRLHDELLLFERA